MGTASERLTMVNKRGLHARASGKFARLAGSFDADIEVVHDGETANGTYIMDLLMLQAHKGTQIELRATGPDAARAVEALASLVRDGFGEIAEEQNDGRA